MKFNVKYFIFAFYFTDFEIVVLKGADEVSGEGGTTMGMWGNFFPPNSTFFGKVGLEIEIIKKS